MRFFNKFIFICSICFLAAVVLRLVEISRKSKGFSETVIPLPALQGSIVILGYVAVIFNFLFVLLMITQLISGRGLVAPKWMTLFNMLMLPVQVWYFFFSKF